MMPDGKSSAEQKFKLQDLIDIKQFQLLQDRLNEIYSFPSAIIDNEGNILTATAWQDICTKFHRTNEESRKECVMSDQYILSHLHEADPAVTYRCPHGLVDNAAPIIIEGVHYGNFFTGQFFLEKPDIDFFKKQAKKFGFDESAYIEAVRKVPIWNKEQLDNYLYFIKGLIEVISNAGLKNLKEKASGRQIRESEEKYRNLVETLTQPVFTMNREGVYLFMNTTAAAQLGGRAEDFIGKTMFEVFPENVAKLQMDNILQAMDSGVLVESSSETVISGRNIWYYARIQPLKNESGAYDKVLVILDDITARKRAEQDLYNTSETLKAIFQVSPLAIVVLDLEDKVRMWNPAAEHIFGWKEEEVLGCPLPFIADSRLEESENKQGQIMNSADFISREVTHIRKDGKVIFLSFSSAALYDTDGKQRGRMAIMEDISSRKQAETRVRNALIEKETLLRELYHRTKNNMQVIISMLSLQSYKTNDPVTARVFKETENRIQTMALVHEMLYQEKDLSSIELNHYLNELGNILFRSFSFSNGIRLSMDLAEERVLIDTAIPCGLILNELMSNAFKHAFPGGRHGTIHLGISRVDTQTLEMVFSDDGIGVPEDFDFRNQKSLGFQTIISLTEQQLQGKVYFESSNGCTWRLRFLHSLHKARV